MSETIPAEALANHIAILGKTGSGKSNGAKTVVEGLLDRGERVCVLDPTGTWFGLRLTRAGKPSPYPIVIFGGAHGDLQIGGAHGAAIAETVGTTTTPAVIDTRLLSVADRTRFFTDFAEALLRKNQGALTLVIDEAHLFAPKGKVNDPKSGMMLGAANNLVSLGRGIGLRIILISQRPAKLHNDALGQVETLVAMRMILPHDREAVMNWVKEQADAGQGREIVASLPSLPTGDAWVWAPGLDLLERRHFPLARTFDSGSVQASGAAGPELAPLDIEEVTARLKASAADVIANDPKALKAEIAKLRAELAKKPAAVAAEPDIAAITRAEQTGYERGHDDGGAQVLDAFGGIAKDLAASIGAAKEACERAERLLGSFATFSTAMGEDRVRNPPREREPNVAHERAARRAGVAPPPRPRAATPVLEPLESRDSPALTGPQRRLINALAWWEAFGIAYPSSEQVAFVAGYSASSSGYANLKGGLRSAGLIDYPSPGTLRLTTEGAPLAEPVQGEVTRDAFHAAVRAKLSAPQLRLLNPLIEAYPESLAKTELAERADYSPSSSGFANLCGNMRTLGFLDYPAPGMVRASDWLFP